MNAMLKNAIANGSLEKHLSKLGYAKKEGATNRAQGKRGSEEGKPTPKGNPPHNCSISEQNVQQVRSTSFVGNGWAKCAPPNSKKKTRLEEAKQEDKAAVKEILVQEGWDVPVTFFNQLSDVEPGIAVATKAQAQAALIEYANAQVKLAVLSPAPIPLPSGQQTKGLSLPFKDVGTGRITIRARYFVPLGKGAHPEYKSTAPKIKVLEGRGESRTVTLSLSSIWTGREAWDASRLDAIGAARRWLQYRADVKPIDVYGPPRGIVRNQQGALQFQAIISQQHLGQVLSKSGKDGVFTQERSARLEIGERRAQNCLVGWLHGLGSRLPSSRTLRALQGWCFGTMPWGFARPQHTSSR